MVYLGVWPVSPLSAAQVLGHTARDHLQISGLNLGRDQCKASPEMRAIGLPMVRLPTGHGLVRLRARATGQHRLNNLVDTPSHIRSYLAITKLTLNTLWPLTIKKVLLMKLSRSKMLVSLLLSIAVLGGCKENPPAAEACVTGPNGGNPVIIVGGLFLSTAANDLFLGNAIQAQGYTYCILEVKGTEELGELPGTMNIAISGLALAAFVNDVLEWSGATKVDLVGHSQGALASRFYLKYFGGQATVGKLISLAGPNKGTSSIPLLDFFAGPVLGAFGVECEGIAPCVQMQIDSDFITELNAGDMTPGSVEYFAFYTSNDELVWYWDEGPFGIPIVKFDNAELGPGATNIDVGEMCPFRWVGHIGMIADPVPIEMTLDALAGNPISVPYLLCWLPPVVL